MKKYFSLFVAFCSFVALSSTGYYLAFGNLPFMFKQDVRVGDIVYVDEMLALLLALSIVYQLENFTRASESAGKTKKD